MVSEVYRNAYVKITVQNKADITPLIHCIKGTALHGNIIPKNTVNEAYKVEVLT
jgi:hypothetical protein